MPGVRPSDKAARLEVRNGAPHTAQAIHHFLNRLHQPTPGWLHVCLQLVNLAAEVSSAYAFSPCCPMLLNLVIVARDRQSPCPASFSLLLAEF